jgi:hypothetical protein
MMPMGPEALMVRSKMDARLELAEFMRLEYSQGDATGVEAEIRAQLEQRPRVPTVTRRIQLWSKRLLARPARETRTRVEAPMGAIALPDDCRRDALVLGGATLAALAATRREARPEVHAAPIAALPVQGRW